MLPANSSSKLSFQDAHGKQPWALPWTKLTSASLPQLENDTADADIPVTLADQTNINAFSKLNNRVDEVADQLEVLQKELEDIEEVETEMELMDEDELVM